MRLRLPKLSLRHWVGPALIALLAGAAVIGTLDPAGSYPRAPQGPGLTLDESFNVQQGVRLAEALPAWAAGALSWREVFGTRDELGPNARFGYHLPDHPPLGRLWIGVFHNLTRAIAPPEEAAVPFVTACARSAPAAAFVLTVLLVGWTAARWHGTAAGLVAAAAVALMPRLFAHAHLASLETFIGLAYAAGVIAAADWWRRPDGEPEQWRDRETGRPGDGDPGSAEEREADPVESRVGSRKLSAQLAVFNLLFSPSSRLPVPLRRAAVAGTIFGLALLTKMQAVLLPIPVVIWALWHWRWKALLPLAALGTAGLAVFFALWPWLWFDPVAHVQEYLGRATDRVPLYVWHFGQRSADTQVPWHYPAVLFLTTVPVGLHALGGLGVFCGERRAWRDPRLQLVLATVFFPLAVFALPGVAVYDGARLFLVVFPLWGILIGRGGAAALEWLRGRLPVPAAAAALGLFVALQGYGLLAMHPCQLSYYNLLTGGLYGADRLGLETTYWGDSVTRDFLQKAAESVPEGAVIEVAPVLHQFQLSEMENQSPILRRRGIRLQPLTEVNVHGQEAAETRYVLLFRRKADLPPEWRDGVPAGRVMAEVRRQGVWLAALYELSTGE